MRPWTGLAGNSIVLAASRAATGLGRAAAMMLAARSVAVAEFGELTLAFALVDIFRQLADLGVEVVSTRELARARPDAAGGLAGTALGLKTAIGVAAYGALVLAAGALRGRELVPVAAVVGATVVTWSAVTGAAAYFQARLAMARVAWTGLVGTLVTVLLVIGLTQRGGHVVGFAGAFLVGEVVAAALAVRALCAALALRLDRAVARDLLRRAWPAAVRQMLVIGYFRLDVIMLSWLGRAEDLGLYGVAYKITEPLLLAPAAIGASFYSAASASWDRGGRQAALRLYRHLGAGALAYGLAVALVLTVGAPTLLGWIVPRYAAAAPVLRILSWSLVFMSLNMVTTAALQALGAHGATAAIAAATLAVCFVANAVLIPRFGIAGASAATVLTEAVNGALQLATLALVLRGPARAAVI